jgi:hypothetical protein
VAARTTRQAKEHGVEGELVARWRGELASIGWPAVRLTAAIDSAAQELGSPPSLKLKSVRRMLGEVLAADGELARRKVLPRRHLLVELAPRLFGQDPRLLDLLVGRALQDPEVIPLAGVAGASEQPHALASVLATEAAIATAMARQLERTKIVPLEEILPVALAGGVSRTGGVLGYYPAWKRAPPPEAVQVDKGCHAGL